MTIQGRLTPATFLRAATGAALAGLAASARNPSGAGRALLEGVPPGASVNPPPAPQAMPPPAPQAVPPPPANVNPPPAPQAPPPPAPQGVPPTAPQTTPAPQTVTPPGAPATPVYGVTPAITPCNYIQNTNIDGSSLYCYLECTDVESVCNEILAVKPGPNPQAGMVRCPFVPDTFQRVYLPAKDCSNNCHELETGGLQGGPLTQIHADWSGRVCYGYDYPLGSAQIINSHAIVGPISMTTNPAICLDTMGGLGTAGTLVNILHCNGQPSQEWSLETVPNTSVYQRLKSQGMCLDVEGGALVANAFLKLAECDSNSPTQGWAVTEQSNEIYAINSGETLCLDTLGALDYDYISAVLTPCMRDSSTPTQRWDI